MTAAEKAKQREYRRIRKMVVSMRIHALVKKKSAERSFEDTAWNFYDGQESAMAQLLEYMAPKEKRKKAGAKTK
jgi:hypothetical protein